DVRFRLRVGRVLRHRRGVVGEAGLAHVLDRVAGRAHDVQQVTDGQATLARGDDAITTLRHDQVAGGCTVAGDHRLDVHAVPGAGALRPRLILLAPDELLAKRLGALAIATAALDLGDQLLGSLQTR